VIQRRRSEKPQRWWAKKYRVSFYRYRRWELDQRDAGQPTPPIVAVGRLEKHEVCFILRRRAGTAARLVAAALGITTWWFCQMEQGKVPGDRLEEYWTEKQRAG
jgi:hypothetical protein